MPTPNQQTDKITDNTASTKHVSRSWLRRLLSGSHELHSGLTGLGWLALPLIAIVLAVLLPVASMAVIAVTGADSNWSHLMAHVLPRSIVETLTLSTGVAAVTVATGCVTAWLVTMHEFPGRNIFDRLLVIPLAIPTYIVAYCYVEILDFGGPVQTALRSLTGWTNHRDYWFPEIRSTGGAIVVLSAVLYPYVYLAARASFVQQSDRALEVARTLGHSEMSVFWSVALPMARPALTAGAALALMECLNDLGAVEYLGVETLAATIYTTWIQRSDLGGAAQIASIMLVFVFVLFTVERISRGAARYNNVSGKTHPVMFARLTGWWAAGAFCACAIPVLIGFVFPVLVLVHNAWSIGWSDAQSGFLSALRHSVTLAGISAVIAIAAGLMLAYAQRISPSARIRATVRFSALGYAIPGTVLGLGIFIPLAGLDGYLSAWTAQTFGFSTGQLFAGTMFTLVLAYVIRYLAVSLGAIDAGFQRISPNLDAAARTQGETNWTILQRVHVPLLLPAFGAAGLMVFVDTMKELPATLLLRPFNFETLATQVYNAASLSQFEEASLSALAILTAGLIPVLVLHRTMSGRAKRHPKSINRN